MTIKSIFASTAVFILAACAPQAEFVKTKAEITELRSDVKVIRAQIQDVQAIEKRLNMIDAHVKGLVDVQKTVADHGAKFDQFTMDIKILQGKIEENNFRIKELAQKLDDKTYRISELAARVEELEKKLKAVSEGISSAPSVTLEKDKKPEVRLPEPSEAYRQAKTDYDKGNFDLAVDGFQNYIKLFPDASQVDSAQYWIGECWYSKKEYGKAIEEFLKVLRTYPKSEKAPGARLKIGFSYLNEKNTVKAKEHLNKVIKDYPYSREAEIAKDKLKKIGK